MERCRQQCLDIVNGARSAVCGSGAYFQHPPALGTRLLTRYFHCEANVSWTPVVGTLVAADGGPVAAAADLVARL